MATDSQKETTSKYQGLQRVGENSQESSFAGIAENNETEGEWTLQLLSCSWECFIALYILQGGGEITLQVVESKKSKA